MSKNEQKKIQKRNALLKSAYELFTTVGYHKTAVLAITLKAGVSKGSFYNYFKDKEDIRDALIISKSSSLLSEALDRLTANDQQLPPVEKIIYVIDYVLDRLSRDIALLRFISKNLSWGLFINSGKYKQPEDDTAIDFRDFIARMLAADGIEPSREMELTMFTVLELVNSTCYNVILEGEPTTLSEYKPYLYNCVRQIFHQILPA